MRSFVAAALLRKGERAWKPAAAPRRRCRYSTLLAQRRAHRRIGCACRRGTLPYPRRPAVL